MHHHFQNKSNRDREAKRLRDRGLTVTKRSQRNVMLSPDYVADYTGTPCPNGFGGAAPDLFHVIYTVEAR